MTHAAMPASALVHDISFGESPPLSDEELNGLFQRSWNGYSPVEFQPLLARSLVYIAARRGTQLVGFVNVATDGGSHAFLLDLTVLPELRHRGIGSALVQRAILAAARRGTRWMHADYAPEHEELYRRAGYPPSPAGLIELDPDGAGQTTPGAERVALGPPPLALSSGLAPFEQLRATGLLFQCFAGALAAILVARVTPGFADVWKSQPALFALFYLGIGIVLLVRGQNAQLDAERLFGPVPSLETLRLAVVALPLGMLAIAGFWLLFLPLSFVVPDFVRGWAIANANQHPVETLSIWTGQLLVAVVIAPVVEEVLFRGILMQRWALRWGTRTGIILSSAVFAVGHVELLGHFVFGVVMCVMYMRTRSLLLPIATHALNNLLASLGGLASVIKPERVAQQMTMATLRADWWIGVLFLAGGLALLDAYRRRYWGGVELATLLDGPVPYAI